MNRAYIALGTNIEPRYTHLMEAIDSLDNHEAIRINKKSSIYETVPVGYLDQAYFLNMVLEIDTSLLPLELLDDCQRIEKQLGRERHIRFGPRTIDLDILTYNDKNMATERLLIPHPRMQERAFVLVPLAEVAPELIIPGVTKKAKTLLKELPESDKKDVKIWIPNESENV